MNWQLLIKMVSSPLCPAPPPCSPFRKIDRETRNGSRKGGRGGWFREKRDAVSILFVHANYSSWVTLLEIEGTPCLFLLFLRQTLLSFVALGGS